MFADFEQAERGRLGDALAVLEAIQLSLQLFVYDVIAQPECLLLVGADHEDGRVAKSPGLAALSF